MSELKPCPFCGSGAEVEKSGEGVFETWYVTCAICCASVWETTEAGVIEAWNTRHERTCDGCDAYEHDLQGWCENCARAYPDNYMPKGANDADN